MVEEPGSAIQEAPLLGVRRYRPLLIDRGSQYAEEFALLAELDAENRIPGADLRARAREIARHPGIVRWLEESDQLLEADDMKGRADLVAARRKGILRHTFGIDRGFPIMQPVPPPVRSRAEETLYSHWWLRHRDELEWVLMRVMRPTKDHPYWRPAKQLLRHPDVRAITDWKASHLDRWLAYNPHLMPERRQPQGSREVVFDTDEFMIWWRSQAN